MTLVFSEICLVKLTNCPERIQLFIKNEGLVHHMTSIDNGQIQIEVEFRNLGSKNVLEKFHPNACVTDNGFAFHDDNEKRIYPDYNFKNEAKIVSDSQISKSLFWEVLLDHIKLFLLKKEIITLHAAGLRKDDKAILFFGWDGTGKSSLLIDSLSNGYQYMGDDRIFITSEGQVSPLFQSIKQFHHELLNYPQLMSTLGFKKRFFIKWSQRLDKNQSKLNSLLLRLFRKLKLNFVVLPAESFGTLENRSSKLDRSFYVNKTTIDDLSIGLNENLLQRLASNVVYADTDTLKRYNTALFSGLIHNIDHFDQLYTYVHHVLSKALKNQNIQGINVSHTTTIQYHLWDY